MDSDFPAAFAELLDPASAPDMKQAARTLARYHHFRQYHGRAHDAAMLQAMKDKGYLPVTEADKDALVGLDKNDRMVAELIRAVLQCLKDGREIHAAMMCGLTACAAR